MAKVVAYAKSSINSGDYNDSDTVSLFGTPGKQGISAGYYRCDIDLHLALCDDMSLWIAPAGGTVAAGHKRGSNRANWTPILYAYPDQFYAYFPVGGHITHYLGAEPPGGTVIDAATVFSGFESSTSSGGTEGSVSYTMYSYGAATVGQEPPSGYVKVNSNITTSGSDSSSRTAWTWLSGVVSYGSPDTDPIWMPSQKVSISSNEILDLIFDYYPWQRRISDIWYSLNRNGSSSTSAGLFRRIDGSYSKCTNVNGDASKSHGFRYNNGWQVSPKSGQGA